MPEHPGHATVDLVKTSGRYRGRLAAEMAAFRSNLTRLRDRFVALPAFNPARGVEPQGQIITDEEAVASSQMPISASGWVKFYPYNLHPKTGLPVRAMVADAEIWIYINDPVGGLERLNVPGGVPGFYYPVRRAGETGGFPIYRAALEDEILILNPSSKPSWIPVTRQEYLEMWTGVWQKNNNEEDPPGRFVDFINRNKAALAAMSPEDRAKQARQSDEDYVLQGRPGINDGTGALLVKPNPDWYDPSLPRSAIQMVTVRFWYRGGIDPDHPAPGHHGRVNELRMWELLHKSDWKAFSGVFAGE